MSPPLYITTPIYYASGPPHIGHAYTTIVADALARQVRAARGDGAALLLTGTDEHGQKIERAAAAAGVPTQQFVDHIAHRYAEAWGALGIRWDTFVQTSNPQHALWVQSIWKRMADAGDIYAGQYVGLYCEGCEAFVTEQNLRPRRLCPDHGTPAQQLAQDCYFFRLSRYRDPLRELLAGAPPFVFPPARLNEVRTPVVVGLDDLCISRPSRGWGIQVPGDPAQEVYVWLDALLSYFAPKFWELPWAPRIVHLIGKEIVTFHAVYWPAFLWSAGLPLPSRVVAHGWWTVQGEKMSKTRGNVVDPVPLARHLGADALRYFLLREVPLGEDGDISPARILHRYNSELCNDLGNLLSRTLHLAEKRSGGLLRRGALDPDLACRARDCQHAAGEAMRPESLNPAAALEHVFELVRAGNAYIERSAPWSSACRDAPAVLYNAAELLRWVAMLGSPFMPERCAEILRQIGLEPAARLPQEWGGLPDGTTVRRGSLLFPRLAPEQVQAAWSDATA